MSHRSFLLLALTLIILSLTTYEVYGHTVSPIRPGPVRSDNENYSSDNISVGDTIEISGELVNLVNGSITISSISITDGTENTDSNWQIINNTGSFALRLGERKEYNIHVKSLNQGIFHLHPVFHVDDFPEKIGVGQTITVFPEYIKTYMLVVESKEFAINYILEQPYELSNIYLDKELKTLFLRISTEETVDKDKPLIIWIPTELIHNKGLGEDFNPSRTLIVETNDITESYYSAKGGEDDDQYIVNIPANTSTLQITMKGAYVTPEIPFYMVGIVLTSAFSLIMIVNRLKSNKTI